MEAKAASDKQLSVKLLSSISSFKGLNLRMLLLTLSVTTVFSGNIVKFLPGYNGELPFKLETGYISVGDSELFYYFIESQGDPGKDPLFLWLTGGPGCSSFNGLIYEVGPLEFDINNYKGGLPRLKYYPYAWTKSASIIFLDAPIGSGFSYSKTPEGWPSSDSKSAEQSYQFLKKWLLENPKYLSVELYIAGDSYSGILAPLVTKKVVEGNEPDANPQMNLIGYVVGSPLTDTFMDENSRIVFAHHMSLITDELHEELKTNCQENYVSVDPSNIKCVGALNVYERCISGLNQKAILEPKCAYALHDSDEELRHRSLQENHILSSLRLPDWECRNFNNALSYIWANSVEVQDALNVRKGFVSYWKRCNKSISYTSDIPSVIDVHRNLSKKRLQVLVNSGDHDMSIPIMSTHKWIKMLNLTIEDDWRPWFVDGQVAGYTMTYLEDGYRLTFATVKGAGHVAPEYKRQECFEMFQRWIHWYPL